MVIQATYAKTWHLLGGTFLWKLGLTLFHTGKTAALVNLSNCLDHKKTLGFVKTYINQMSAVKPVGAITYIDETSTGVCQGKAGVSNTLGAAL